MILIKPSGFDITGAGETGKLASNAVGIVTYRGDHSGCAFRKRFTSVLNSGYVTEGRARGQLTNLRPTVLEAVVGAGLITDLAEEAGMTAIFIYSRRPFVRLFHDALDMTRLTCGASAWITIRQGITNPV